VWFEDLNPGASLAPIGAVGFELWTMDDGVLFDNVLIGRSEAEAAAFAASTWAVRHAAEVAAKAAKDKADAEAAAGSLKDRASSYVQQAVMLAVTKPVPTGIALFVTLALLITSCLLPRGAGKKKDAAAAAAKPAAAPADKATANKAARGSGDKASGDEEDEAAETSAAKPAAAAKRAPRRTPKASD
jgi:calnexin